MLSFSAKCLKFHKIGYILTLPKSHTFSEYQAFIPKKYVFRKDVFRYIDLPDTQKIKIKKGDDLKVVTIKELKGV